MKIPRSLAWRLGLAVGTVLFGVSTAFAQAPAPAAAAEERILQLEREVDALRAAIEALKKPEPAPQPAPETAPSPDKLAEVEAKIDVLAAEIEKLKIGEAAAVADLGGQTRSDQGMGPAASKVYRAERGVSIGGYGEALYQNFDAKTDDGAPSEETDELALERAVVYVGYKWNDRFLFNSEVEFEDAGEEVSVEFAYLDYLWKPEASFRAGLLLMPVGFLNELHEPTVFLGTHRPEVERRILPSTWQENGIGLFGEVGPLSYRTYVVNGLDASGFSAEGLREGRQGGAEAKAKDFAWVGRADWTAAPGLLAGGSVYLGKAGQGIGSGVRTRMFEGHVEWRKVGLELRALGVQADLDDIARLNDALGLSGADSVGERMTGGYVQAGYDLFARFPHGEQALIPFVRYESFDTQARVPVGFERDPGNDVDILTLGLSYKPIPQVVFKADFENRDDGAGTGQDRWSLGLGYVF